VKKELYIQFFICDNLAHNLFLFVVFYQRAYTPTASILSFTVFDTVAGGSTSLRDFIYKTTRRRIPKDRGVNTSSLMCLNM